MAFCIVMIESLLCDSVLNAWALQESAGCLISRFFRLALDHFPFAFRRELMNSPLIHFARPETHETGCFRGSGAKHCPLLQATLECA
jgi:hypothetical protein